FVELYIDYLIQNPFLPSYLLQVSTNHSELLAQVNFDFPKKFVSAFEAAAKAGTIRNHDSRQFIIALLSMCVMPFVGKNLIKGFLGLSDRDYQLLLKERAEEVKRYVVLLLAADQEQSKEP